MTTDELARCIAQAMADFENEHRYQDESGFASPMVEPYEADADDYAEIASYIAVTVTNAR